MLMKIEIDFSEDQYNFIINAGNAYLYAINDVCSYDEIQTYNKLFSDFLAQIPDEVFEEV